MLFSKGVCILALQRLVTVGASILKEMRLKPFQIFVTTPTDAMKKLISTFWILTYWLFYINMQTAAETPAISTKISRHKAGDDGKTLEAQLTAHSNVVRNKVELFQVVLREGLGNKSFLLSTIPLYNHIVTKCSRFTVAK